MSQNMTNADDDAMSEFSVATAESELRPSQNILDLRVSTVEFDKTSINSIMGMREALPSSIITFVGVDFYNHATKSTNPAQGYEP